MTIMPKFQSCRLNSVSTIETIYMYTLIHKHTHPDNHKLCITSGFAATLRRNSRFATAARHIQDSIRGLYQIVAILLIMQSYTAPTWRSRYYTALLKQHDRHNRQIKQ